MDLLKPLIALLSIVNPISAVPCLLAGTDGLVKLFPILASPTLRG